MKESTHRLGWVRAVILERNKGMGLRILEKCRHRGQFVEGIHWKKVNGVIMYNYEAIDQLYEEADVA
ncbi:excisionase family protein [Alteromonas sp. RKMC-009]|uniref:excisionase family protein n=1 Tax=Alteromonas sp. RKMC-009 TaxID=2267264 RepID=UPI000E68ADC6|nr:excisionase family protein [Alteromonas sp. RKMC-009]AYA64263.1 hypothetical protein DS731_09810 [Alteromonas sp. RKMC-009]